MASICNGGGGGSAMIIENVLWNINQIYIKLNNF